MLKTIHTFNNFNTYYLKISMYVCGMETLNKRNDFIKSVNYYLKSEWLVAIYWCEWMNKYIIRHSLDDNDLYSTLELIHKK